MFPAEILGELSRLPALSLFLVPNLSLSLLVRSHALPRSPSFILPDTAPSWRSLTDSFLADLSGTTSSCLVGHSTPSSASRSRRASTTSTSRASRCLLLHGARACLLTLASAGYAERTGLSSSSSFSTSWPARAVRARSTPRRLPLPSPLHRFTSSSLLSQVLHLCGYLPPLSMCASCCRGRQRDALILRLD